MGEFLPLTANRKYVAQYALPPATYVRPFLFGGGAPPQFQCSLQCGTGPINFGPMHLEFVKHAGSGKHSMKYNFNLQGVACSLCKFVSVK